jgi:hypothetical protein
MANILYTFESRLRPLSSRIVSKDLPIQKRTQKELNFWQGKKETSSSAYPVLKKYWDGVGVRSWSPSGTPWSAAFISYLLQGTGFKGSSGHYIYTESAMKGIGGWRAISVPKNKGKIQVAVGDVFVKPRSGGHTNTHGDVVYKISGGKAYLAGGNVSNTAKGNITLPVDKNRTLLDGGKYLIVLKKSPKYETGITVNKVLAYGGFSLATVLTGTLVYMVGKRKGYWEELGQKFKQIEGS